jgi:hypothetical protein
MEPSTAVTPEPLDDEQAWYVATRWQQLDGEYRANHLRIISVVAFYAIHLVQYYHPFGLLHSAESPDGVFHFAATLIAAGWLSMAMAVDIMLRQRYFPPSIPFVTTGIDMLLLTSLLALGGGQTSPLVTGYFLVLILSMLRFHLPLIRSATAAALFCYLFLMAMGRWPQLFGDRVIGVVPRYAQLMTLLAIAISGIMLGQAIRRFQQLAHYYALRRSRDADHES